MAQTSAPHPSCPSLPGTMHLILTPGFPVSFTNGLRTNTFGAVLNAPTTVLNWTPHWNPPQHDWDANGPIENPVYWSPPRRLRDSVWGYRRQVRGPWARREVCLDGEWGCRPS